MDKLKPCPYTDEEVSRKLRKWKGHCQIPGLDELILWAADIIDRRPAPENKPLTQIIERIHAIPPETFVGTYGDFELVEAIKDSCCEAVEELGAQLSGNKPLTMNELIGMNGLPVWCVDGEGHGCYCLVNTDSEDCIDSESGAWCFEFYNMTGGGKHGLHISGWLAYARKPEQEEN